MSTQKAWTLKMEAEYIFEKTISTCRTVRCLRKLQPWRWRQNIYLKRRYPPVELHDVSTQKASTLKTEAKCPFETTGSAHHLVIAVSCLPATIWTPRRKCCHVRAAYCALKTGSKLRVKLRYPLIASPSIRILQKMLEGRRQYSESAVTCYIRWQTDSSWLLADIFISPPVGEPLREKTVYGNRWLVCRALCGTVVYGNL
jgi:hypothetical protein